MLPHLKSSRLWLHWDEHLKDYVHKPTGATLTALSLAARDHGYRWHLAYPEGRKERWVWFEISKVIAPRRRRR